MVPFAEVGNTGEQSGPDRLLPKGHVRKRGLGVM